MQGRFTSPDPLSFWMIDQKKQPEYLANPQNTRLGSVTGTPTEGADPGLHVTLMPKSVYQRYIYNYAKRRTANNRPNVAKRDSVPFKSLMDAARSPQSPFRCP